FSVRQNGQPDEAAGRKFDDVLVRALVPMSAHESFAGRGLRQSGRPLHNGTPRERAGIEEQTSRTPASAAGNQPRKLIAGGRSLLYEEGIILRLRRVGGSVDDDEVKRSVGVLHLERLTGDQRRQCRHPGGFLESVLPHPGATV